MVVTKRKGTIHAVRPHARAATPDEEAESDRQSTRAKFPLPCEFKEGKAIKSIERSPHLRDCRITRRFVHGKEYVPSFGKGIRRLTTGSGKSADVKTIYCLVLHNHQC